MMSFGGVLGLGEEDRIIPWAKLSYDTTLGGYRTDIEQSELERAPSFASAEDEDWSSREQEAELHAYYRIPALLARPLNRTPHASMFSIRTGRSRTRMPVACQTALAIAGAVPTIGSSPMPLTPSRVVTVSANRR